MTRPNGYEPAARALAILCQSDGIVQSLDDLRNRAWAPPEVLRLEPSWIKLKPDIAHVEFGGGFHHFGYDLHLDGAAGDDLHNRWILDFYSEDSAPRTLLAFNTLKTDHLDRQEFIRGALAEYQRRLESGRSHGLVADRTSFLLKLNEPTLALEAVRKGSGPFDWQDPLLRFIIDSPSDPSEVDRLEAWAWQHDDFESWILVAYAYSACGRRIEAELATKQALFKPVIEADWCEWNINHLTKGLCVSLLDADRLQTCIALCDAVISAGGHADMDLAAIRNAAQSRQDNLQSAPSLSIDKNSLFNLFEEIDLDALRAEARRAQRQ